MTAGIVTYAHPDLLNAVRPDNPVSVIAKSDYPASLFGLVQGEKRDSQTNRFPVIKDLIYNADVIEVRGSAWLTWTKGIY